MDQGSGSGLFVNDGSFMKRFKKLDQHENPPPPPPSSQDREREEIRSNRATGANSSETRRANAPAAGGKLAFSLKPKAKIAIARVKLGGDEEEDGDEVGCSNDSSKRRKLSRIGTDESAVQHGDDAPSSPSDPAVRKVADRLASFVAKNGRPFEHVTHQWNPGDTPFKFLYDTNCSDYKYYEHKLLEEENTLSQTKESQMSDCNCKSYSSSISKCFPNE